MPTSIVLYIVSTVASLGSLFRLAADIRHKQEMSLESRNESVGDALACMSADRVVKSSKHMSCSYVRTAGRKESITSYKHIDKIKQAIITFVNEKAGPEGTKLQKKDEARTVSAF